jgi:hypothetical protein
MRHSRRDLPEWLLAAFALLNLYRHRKKLFGTITPLLVRQGEQCLWKPEIGLRKRKPKPPKPHRSLRLQFIERNIAGKLPHIVVAGKPMA